MLASRTTFLIPLSAASWLSASQLRLGSSRRGPRTRRPPPTTLSGSCTSRRDVGESSCALVGVAPPPLPPLLFLQPLDGIEELPSSIALRVAVLRPLEVDPRIPGQGIFQRPSGSFPCDGVSPKEMRGHAAGVGEPNALRVAAHRPACSRRRARDHGVNSDTTTPSRLRGPAAEQGMTGFYERMVPIASTQVRGALSVRSGNGRGRTHADASLGKLGSRSAQVRLSGARGRVAGPFGFVGRPDPPNKARRRPLQS